MIFNIPDLKICKGAFADVFINSDTKRAFKLFKSYQHPDLNGTGKDEIGEEKTNYYRKKVFQTELDAYELAQNSEILKKHTPLYFGKYSVQSVVNNGRNLTNHYLTDCCFQIEYVIGEESKLNHINDGLLKHLEVKLKFNLSSLYQEFQNSGIRYTYDASVIFNDSEFKILDFGIQDPQEFVPLYEL